MLIDSHAHLDNPRFQEDRVQVIARCAEKLTAVINVGYDLVSSSRSINLAETYPFIFAAVGIHPHDAKEAPENYLEQLREMAGHPRVVAIGEMGLDYYYDLSPRDIQQRVFREQLLLAKDLKKPFIIHDRDAHGDMMQILRKEAPYPAGGVMHCFSASWEIAKECMKLGLFISLAGPVTFANAGKLKDIAVKTPLDRLLVETDCPYLTPVPHRGKRNEPAYVQHTVDHVAELRNMTASELAQQAAENTIRLFNLPIKTNG